MEEITQGAAHPLESTKNKIREYLLSHGFDEYKLREGWTGTINAVKKKKELPIKIFSGTNFVIIGGSAMRSADTATSILNNLGIKDSQNENDTISVMHNNEKKIVASMKKINEEPISFEVSFNIQDITLMLSGKKSTEEMLYPQFYEKPSMTDEQIAAAIKIKRGPETELGKVISQAIIRTATEKCQQLSPCRFRAYSRELRNGKLEIWLVQPTENKTLCGNIFMNRICIYAGNVVAMPPIKEKGIKTGISLVSAFADYVSSAAENISEDYKLIKVGKVESWQDINLTVSDTVLHFIEANDKEMDIKGDLDLTAEIKFQPW